MRIDILAIGSQGDVRPNVALGLGLRRRGHQVRIVTLDGFEPSVRAHGLDYLAIASSPKTIANTSAGRGWVERRGSTIGFVRGFVRVARSLIEEGIRNYWRACQAVDAIIVSPMGLPIGVHVAERLQVPIIREYFAPGTATRYDFDGRKNLRTAVRASVTAYGQRAFRLALWSALRRTTNDARQTILNLPPLPRQDPFGAMDQQRVPVLHAFSDAVVTRPPDWPSWVHVTGYWFLDDAQDWLPPNDLVDFLNGGAPPVFVGFGSTPFPEPAAATRLVTDALQRAGQRGIVVAGGSGLATGRLTDDILSVEAVPHDWLLPKVRAAVHHGGAGVTGAALRAGLPSVVVPVFGDQPFWSSRVFALGAGPRPIPARKLTAERLAAAIRATADPDMRQRAAVIGASIRSEDGVAHAVRAIEEYAAAWRQDRGADTARVAVGRDRGELSRRGA